MRLGEVLIAEDVIGPQQLQEALEVQLTYGGHLGTCLIELGHVTEERLGKALARASGVPCAPSTAFLDVPRLVLDALPQGMVQKHAAIPIRLEDRILDVAMIDPKNLQAIDELRAASGCAIRAWIAPEARIFQAMDKYYDVPRRIRYVTLCRTLDRGRRAVERSSFAGPATAVLEAAAPSATALRLASVPADPLAAVSAQLCRATTEDQIADHVLDAMQGDFRRRVLFRVRGRNAYVWRSAGAAIDPSLVAGVPFPILSEPVFGLLNGDDYYAGPLPSDLVMYGFYQKLGIDTPHQILVRPVHLDEQLVALFYGDCGRTGTIGLNLEDHRRLLVKAALAIDVLQTKLKIQTI